ncbi:MAG: hypothetical protein Q4B09_07765, partial [Lachnospiraceae bacterium]|nr:hypothetical protein [Lachnospiraceae bacterium]
TRSFLNSQKIAPSEADIDKIKNMLLRIIVDIKKSMETKEPTGAIATKEAVEGIRAALPDKPMNELTADDVAEAVTAYVGKAVPMDDASAALLNQLMSQLLAFPSTEENKND